jgi:PAS domain S-box-containing protein
MAPNWVEPERREELHGQFARHGGTADNFEAQFYDKKGEKIWVRFSARVFPERGYMEGVGLGINEEKAQRQALEESEKRLRALAESTSAVIFIMDENNRIRYANKAAVEGTGYTQEELANLDPGAMMTPESQAKMFELEHNADPSDRNFGPFELEIQCKGGEKVWIAMTIGIFEAEGERAYISTSFDITERKKAEEALRQSEASSAPSSRTPKQGCSAWI